MTNYNDNQTYLYYENQLFHSKTEEEAEKCRKEMRNLRHIGKITVSKTAIILVSYNHLELTVSCIESIRKNNLSGTYQLIVVDNASEDGSADWLAKQEDITLIANQENKGFPYACNQGIAKAEEEADIFLLNNDTIVPRDALFWLRMGLYESEKIGAAGSVSNNAVNYQQVSQQYETLEEWMAFAEKNNVCMEYPYEKKSWLMGFAMLIKGTAVQKIREAEGKEEDAVPEILDNRFFPGNFEDNDLSIRLLKNGYGLLLCKNSFIYHYGGSAFAKHQKAYIKLLLENQKKLADKYGIDFIPYSYVETGLIDMIKPEKEEFSVLELECGLGAGLARIKSRYPKAKVIGTEEDKRLAELAAQVVTVCSIHDLHIIMQKRNDYVILNGTLKSDGTQRAILTEAAACLKPGGRILAAVGNRQCLAAVKDGFLLEEIVSLFNECGLQIQEFQYRCAKLNPIQKQELEEIMSRSDAEMRPLYEGEKFIFAAKKQEK